jgi:N utilization substance protein B
VRARSKARKRALDILYEAELRDDAILGTLARLQERSDPPIPEYTVTLVQGVVTEQRQIDTLLRRHSEGWSLERMPVIDRNVLRVGTYELLYQDDVPDAVAVSEAVDLVRQLSTDESPNFVNGLLGRLQQLKPELTEEIAQLDSRTPVLIAAAHDDSAVESVSPELPGSASE